MDDKKPLIIKKFISEEERKVLYNWLTNEYDQGRLVEWNVNYFMAAYKFGDPENQNWEISGKRQLKALQNIPLEFFIIREKIIKELNFNEMVLTKNSTAFGNVFIEGGSIEPHTDSHIEGCWHVRCNVMVSKPYEGGDLVIDDCVYNLEERDLICFLADKYIHKVTNVVGKIKRIMISYPIVASKSYFV